MDPYRYCEWITYRHYENFPVASWLLPVSLRPHVAAVYAFARAADDFADESRYQGRALDLLGQWRESLKACANGRGAQHPIFLALADTIRKKGIPVQLLDDLLTAFTLDVTKRRYADWGELMTYCRYSANPVGRLVLLLHGIRDEELHRRSDDICSGLQLANHWQDLRIDVARDMIYVPQDLMRQHGVTDSDLKSRLVGRLGRLRDSADRSGPHRGPSLNFRLARRPSADTVAARLQMSAPPRSLPPADLRPLMRELVERARALFDSGEPLIRQLRGGLKLEIKLTLLGGRAILDRIEAADYDVFNHRPVLSKPDKMGLLARALF